MATTQDTRQHKGSTTAATDREVVYRDTVTNAAIPTVVQMNTSGNPSGTGMQVLSTANSKTITSSDAAPASPWQGDWELTREKGYVRILIVVSSATASLGGTFIFEFSEDGSTATISETRVISTFNTVRDFDLINAGAYFRCSFEPDEALGANTVNVSTTLREQNDGAFVRLASQELEEANAAMSQNFAYLKAFVASTGLSINVRANPTGQLIVADFQTEVGKGNVTGHALQPIFGYNPSVGASSTEDIIYTGTLNFLQSAAAVRVKVGGNSADNNTSGAGARTVLVEGLDENWDEASETLTLAGASASAATTTTFIRLNKATVVTTGTYGAGAASTAGANTGDITIETTGGTTVLTIQAGVGVSQSSLFTVPNAKTASMRRFASTIDAGKAVDIRLWQRLSADDVSAPFTAKSIVRRYPGQTGDISRDFFTPLQFPAKTDIWVTATTGSGAAGIISVSYDLVLVDE